MEYQQCVQQYAQQHQRQQQGQHQASTEPLACDSAFDTLLLRGNASPPRDEQPARVRFALHRAQSMASGSPAASRQLPSACCQGGGDSKGVGRPERKRTMGHTVSRSLGSDPRVCPFGDPSQQAQTPLSPLGDAFMGQSSACAWGPSAGAPGEDVVREAGALCGLGVGAVLAQEPLGPHYSSRTGLLESSERRAALQSGQGQTPAEVELEQRGLEASEQEEWEGPQERAQGGGLLQWPGFRERFLLREGSPAAAAEPESSPGWQSGESDTECPSTRFLGCSWKELIPDPAVRARLRELDLLNGANSAGSSPRGPDALERCTTTQPALLSWALSSLRSEATGSPLARTQTVGGGLRAHTPRCGTPISSGGTPGGSSEVSPVLRRRVTASRRTVVDDCWLTAPERQRKWAGGIVVDELEQHRREDVAKFLDDFSGIPGIKRKRV